MKTRKSKTGTKITAVAIAAATVVEAIAIRRKQLFILLMVGAVCLGTSQSVQPNVLQRMKLSSRASMSCTIIFQLEVHLEEGGSGKPHYQCHDLPFRACISL